MALPIAPLGSPVSISLGGYIPAARRDPTVLQQALASFLSGSAGAVGGRLVDKVLPDPRLTAETKYRTDQLAQQKAQAEAQNKIDTARLAIESARNAETSRLADAQRQAQIAQWLREFSLGSDELAFKKDALGRSTAKDVTQAGLEAQKLALLDRQIAEQERQGRIQWVDPQTKAAQNLGNLPTTQDKQSSLMLFSRLFGIPNLETSGGGGGSGVYAPSTPPSMPYMAPPRAASGSRPAETSAQAPTFLPGELGVFPASTTPNTPPGNPDTLTTDPISEWLRTHGFVK